MIASGAATALDVQTGDHIVPVRWDDWIKLPVREHDKAVNTPRGPVRVPTVIVAANYAKVPLRRPRFGAAASGSATAACASTPAANSRRRKATSTTWSRAPAAAKRPGTTVS